MLHEPLRAVGRQSTLLHAVQHGGVSCMGFWMHFSAQAGLLVRANTPPRAALYAFSNVVSFRDRSCRFVDCS